MPAKEQRLEARITEKQKELFQYAAAIQGVSLTDFVVHNLQEKAMQLVKDHEVMILSEEDRTVFINALLNPTKPNKELLKAAQEHQKLIDHLVETS